MSKVREDRPGLRERWTGWRNAVLADPRFQRWAARFPLTRPIARRNARALFDMVAGFTYSQTLFACLQLGLLDLLAEGALSTEQIAAAVHLPQGGADRLLRAAASLGLVESVGSGRWVLGSGGAALRGNRGIAEMVGHHSALYADLADPVALLRRGGGGGDLSRFWRYAESAGTGTGDEVGGYSKLMTASQPLIADQLIDAYPFARHRRVLDIGGGEGAFVAALAARVPKLDLGLFDLPAVGERARVRLDRVAPGTCCTILGGDFLTDPLPMGWDLITLVRVLHDHDDGPAMALLRRIHAALPEGGRLLIAEPMAATRGAEPMGDGYFGLYLLAMGSGRPRSAAEIRGMLNAAGFASSRLLRTAMPLTLQAISAKR